MSAPPVIPMAVRFKAFSRFAAGFSVVVPVLILTGWTFDIPVLKSLVPGVKAMNPASAVTFILAGAALFLLTSGDGWGFRSRGIRILSCAVILVGALRGAGFLLNWSAGVDTILFHDRLGGNLMAPGTAAVFVMIGLALIVSEEGDRSRFCPVELLALPPMMISLLALLGYAYHIRALYSVSSFVPMSLHAAILIQVLAFGILCARPDRGVVRLLSSDSGGGRMARQMLPASVGVLCMAGWFRLEGERRGFYGSELGLALFMVANTVILGWLILRNAGQLVHADHEREEIADALRRSREDLEHRVEERTGALARVVAEMTAGISTVLDVAREIMNASERLSNGARESATATAETTATVEEVRQTARMNARDAEQVAASAQHAAHISQDGKRSTDDTIVAIQRVREEMNAIGNSMMRLNDQTQAIGQIMASVNAIAAQSNILAVNAAIEAAKAGERGKGFAIVAREVRTLADQSRRSTRQVGTILHDIQRATHLAIMAIDHGRQAVEYGASQSVQAGTSIETLAAGVQAAAESASHIAGTSRQQMAGIDQVAAAMDSIRQGTIHTVTSARELEVAAQHLKELAQKLQVLIAQNK